jgi:2-iminobutanoate/2-iminopropanoate deaminase
VQLEDMMHPIFHLLPDAPKPVAPYSHAVEAGPFVFVTGQLATDPDDDSLPVPAGIEAQTRKVMDNLARVLRGCGLTFTDVVSVRIFLTDFQRDYATMNTIYATHFAADRRPARTTVGVTALARDGIVEIDMIAVRS